MDHILEKILMTYLKETNGVGVYNTLKAKDVTAVALSM